MAILITDMLPQDEFSDSFHDEMTDQLITQVNRHSDTKRRIEAEVLQAQTAAAETAVKSRDSRRAKILSLSCRLLIAVIVIVALYYAKAEGMIHTAIVTPLTAIGFMYIGWMIGRWR